MKKRFFDVATFITGIFFLAAPLNQTKAESLASKIDTTLQKHQNSKIAEKIYYIAQESTQVDLYGSIAVYGYGSNHGFAWNASTKQGAIDAALQHCFEQSRGKCKTVLWFKNSCGALAGNLATVYSTAYAPDKVTAQQEALKNCHSDYCKIKDVQCTDNVQP